VGQPLKISIYPGCRALFADLGNQKGFEMQQQEYMDPGKQVYSVNDIAKSGSCQLAQDVC
jgi:hypothetical protein